MAKLEDFLELEELPIEPRGPNALVLETICLPENLEKITKDFNYSITDKTKVQITDNSKFRNLEIFGSCKLYVKIAWEGFLKETLALELNNMLTGRSIPYKGYGKNIIVTDDIDGSHAHLFLINQLKDSRKYCYEYGILNEFTKILGLTDRRKDNLIIKDNGEIWNIDLGQSFTYDSKKELNQLNSKLTPIPQHCFEEIAGKRKAQEIIKNNMEKHFEKLKSMLNCIDEETMKELNRDYKIEPINLVHPKEIILTYCRRNKWSDLVKALQ